MAEQSLPDEGWRITFGNKREPGQPDNEMGVALEFEPDTDVASEAFARQVKVWTPGADVRSSLPGYAYAGYVTGSPRYVRMEWVSRPVKSP